MWHSAGEDVQGIADYAHSPHRAENSAGMTTYMNEAVDLLEPTSASTTSTGSTPLPPHRRPLQRDGRGHHRRFCPTLLTDVALKNARLARPLLPRALDPLGTDEDGEASPQWPASTSSPPAARIAAGVAAGSSAQPRVAKASLDAIVHMTKVQAFLQVSSIFAGCSHRTDRRRAAGSSAPWP